MRCGFYELIRKQWRIYLVRAVILALLIWLVFPHHSLWIALVAVEALLWAVTFKTRAHESNIFRLTDDERLFEFVPSISYNYYYPARNIWGQDRVSHVVVGPLGLRVSEEGEQEPVSENRLLALGDSATLGEGVRFAEAYPKAMERALNTHLGRDGAVSVISAAVPGYNTAQAVASLPHLISEFKPRAVLLGVTLEDTLPWGRIEIGEDGEMRRLDAPFRHKVRENFKRLSYILYHISQVYRFVRIDEYTKSTFRDSYVGFRRWREAVGQMASLCRENQAMPIVVVVPGLWKLESGYPWKDIHARIRDVCEGEGIHVIDPLPAVEGYRSKSLWVHPTDVHANAEAHSILGQAIAAEIRPILENCLALDGHELKASEC